MQNYKKILLAAAATLAFGSSAMAAEKIKIGTEEKDGAKKLSFTFENLSAEKFLEIKGEYFEDEATIDEIWENSLLGSEEGEDEAEPQAEPEVTQK